MHAPSTDAPAARAIRLSVVVPVYNERPLVGAMLERLVALDLPSVSELQIVVVDDGSTDGSAEAVEEVRDRHPGRIELLRQERNRGKGAALRRGIAAATGELTVFQDADLEYDPRDFALMLRPFLEHRADVVYGSRFAHPSSRRVLYYRHTLGNRFITACSNLMTDLNLTDVETCYKMFRTQLLKSIPLRCDRFGVEIEITAKVARRGAVVYEVPIDYHGRTYAEGKKIGWRDGVSALFQILRFRLVDDSRHREPSRSEARESHAQAPDPED